MNTIFNKLLIVIFASLTLAACGGGGGDSDPAQVEIIKPKTPVVILIFGDSISQGYGVSAYGVRYQQITPGNTYAELLRLRISKEKLDEFATIRVINDSLGSEYTSDALARLPSVLAFHRPTHVLLAHGTNDAGAAESLKPMKNNLIAMVNLAKGAGAKVLLADITPARRGLDFAASYTKVFSDVAYLLAATYVPMLNGILGNSKYYLADYIHPNDSAQNFMLDNLWAKLLPTFK